MFGAWFRKMWSLVLGGMLLHTGLVYGYGSRGVRSYPASSRQNPVTAPSYPGRVTAPRSSRSASSPMPRHIPRHRHPMRGNAPSAPSRPKPRR